MAPNPTLKIHGQFVKFCILEYEKIGNGVLTMPTYEYKCDSCGYDFEEFQSIKEEPLSKCPKCGGKVQRLIGPGAGLIFKGSGFYLTDYKKSNTSPSTSGGNGAAKKTEPAAAAPKAEKSATNDKPKS